MLTGIGVRAQVDNQFRFSPIPKPGKIRPVKVCFLFISDKIAVLKNKRKIEGNGKNIYFTQDLCHSTRTKQKEHHVKTQSGQPGFKRKRYDRNSGNPAPASLTQAQ
jgi:hypothetical protein